MNLTDDIRELALLDTDGLPVSTFYLNIDRRRYAPLQAAELANQQVRQVRHALPTAALSPSAKRSVEQDIDRFTRFVGAELDLPSAKGLAAYSCSQAGYWKVIALPAVVTSGVKVGRHPQLRPLVWLQDDLAPYAVVLADREKARLFIVEFGGIRELDPVEEDVPGGIRPASSRGLEVLRIERHVDEHMLHHLKRVAATTATIVEWHELSRLVLAGTPETVSILQSLLSPSLSRLLSGVAQELSITSPQDEVLEQSLRVVGDSERRKEAEAVERIRSLRSSQNRGTLGVASTLLALYARSVNLLAVDVDQTVGGWRCRACHRLYTANGPCPECAGHSEWLNDLLDEAIRQAICQDAGVEVVSDPSARSRLQGMGALLHYSVSQLEPAARQSSSVFGL